jgi:hypothetical protein
MAQGKLRIEFMAPKHHKTQAEAQHFFMDVPTSDKDWEEMDQKSRP